MKRLLILTFALFFLLVSYTNTYAIGAPPVSRVPIWCVQRLAACDTVLVFNDANTNGVYEDSEVFSNFSPAIASLTVDGQPVQLGSNGFAKLKLPPGLHTFTLLPTGLWAGTKWQFNNNPVQNYTATGATLAGTFTVTTGLAKLKFGVYQAPPPTPPPSPPPASEISFKGSFIAKGGFVMARDLGPTKNATLPAETFIERPDFWITLNNTNFPAIVRDVLVIPAYNWQEVAP